jgi:general stress protein 26
MFTTVTSDGTLHSRPMATQEIDLVGNALWFFAASNFPKAEEVLHGKEVVLSYASPGKSYVSISGRVNVVHDKAKAQELWSPTALSRSTEGVDDPRLVLLRVDVEAVEYWDSP